MIHSDEEFRRQIVADQLVQQYENMHPSINYRPSRPNTRDAYGGQLNFHMSKHPVRFMCPGNGWGKTAALAHEANAWATHSNRWQKTPRWAVSMIWFGPGLSQWSKIRHELLEPFCLDKPWRYKLHEHAYLFPDGSRLEFRSYDAGWSVEQGINPDLVLFDELPPWDLFREMEMRRRGSRKTRLAIAATQTMGSSWMESVLYDRWLTFHKERGFDEDQAMLAQQHDYIWCWPKGGLRSNPAMTDDDFAHYESNIMYSSDAERRVRLGGGFGDWSGAAVFDLEAVAWMRDAAKRAHALADFPTLNGSIVMEDAT